MPAIEAASAFDAIKGYLPLAISAGAIGIGGYLAVRVGEGEEGLIYQGGRAIRPSNSAIFPWALQGVPYGSVEPGIYFTVPGYKTIQKISTQNKVSPLTPFEHDVIERDGSERQRHIASFLIWGVVRRRDRNKNKIEYDLPYTDLLIRAHCDYQPGDLETTVQGVASDGLETIMDGNKNLKRLNKRRVTHDLVDICGQKLFEQCGVDIRGWGLYTRGHTPADIMRHGLMQAYGARQPLEVDAEPFDGTGVRNIKGRQPDIAGGPDGADVYVLDNYRGDGTLGYSGEPS